MRRLRLPVLVALLWALAAAPASGQAATPVLDRAAASLRADPVYVDAGAPRAVDGGAADRLRSLIRSRGAAVFLAILPPTATTEAGGDAAQVPAALASRVHLAGTYGVVAGSSFRGGSTDLAPGRAGAAATAAFQQESANGTEAVLTDFVDRVSPSSAGGGARTQPAPAVPATGGAKGWGAGQVVLVLLLVAGGLALWFGQRGRRRRLEAEARAQEAKDRSVLRAEVSVLADDVMALEPQVTLHPEARADYDAGVARYKVAEAALEQADGRIDLVRVERVVAEGRYAMTRARAVVEGRQPPPPPSDLAQPGRRQEPALGLDHEGMPVYVGYGGPFYGGGWFG
ncbi:MAG: hypothetical protein ABR511_10650, partial [Acidimicrobiales bacterium]